MNNDNTQVTVSLGYTINLGNFQSIRLDFSVDDYARQGENVNDAFERVYKFVESKLVEKSEEAKQALAE
jgi:methyl coenzyme M reductase subunit D